MNAFQGVYAAAITPRSRQGEVDFGAAFELVDFLCRAGVRGILLFGAAGEYLAFGAEERSRLVYLAAKRSRVPVLAGVGSATLEISVELARHARDAGAAAVLLPPPCFFGYGQEDLREYFLRFAEQTPGVPILLSHTPDYTSGIGAETASDLLASGLFAGIVDGSADLDLFSSLPARDLVAGSDASLTRVRPAAAFSASACAIPELMAALDRAMAADNQAEIGALDGILQQFVAWTRRFPLPTVIKAAVEVRGLKTGPLSAPLSPGRQKDLAGFREWFQACLPALGTKASHV